MDGSKAMTTTDREDILAILHAHHDMLGVDRKRVKELIETATKIPTDKTNCSSCEHWNKFGTASEIGYCENDESPCVTKITKSGFYCNQHINQTT
jgi:hypothetical protein